MAARILVADDSVTIQKVVELTFSKEDFVLVQARSGEEAIRKAKEERPDLVLLDLVMPDKNGYEVCAALRAEPTPARGAHHPPGGNVRGVRQGQGNPGRRQRFRHQTLRVPGVGQQGEAVALRQDDGHGGACARHSAAPDPCAGSAPGWGARRDARCRADAPRGGTSASMVTGACGAPATDRAPEHGTDARSLSAFGGDHRGARAACGGTAAEPWPSAGRIR